MIAAILWLILGGSPDDGQRLVKFVQPNCRITTSEAFEHLVASKITALQTGVDQSIQLAIAEHESCLSPTAPTRSNSNYWFCGPMQTGGTRTKTQCLSQVPTLLHGYYRGAIELKTWQHYYPGQLVKTLQAYSGGRAFARNCSTQNASQACEYAHIFVRHAKRIKKCLHLVDGKASQ